MTHHDLTGISTPSVDVLRTDEGIIRRFGGGPIITTCVALSSWGMKTAVIGRIGEDQYGEWLSRNFSQEGVDTSFLKSDNSPTSVWDIQITPEKKELLQPDTYKPLDRLDENQKKAVADSESVLIRLHNRLFPDVANITKKSGAKLFVTFHFPETKPGREELIKSYNPEIIFMTSDDYEKVVKKFDIFNMDSLFVIMKKEQGCSVMRNGNITSYKGYRSEMVDPTGTNDSFVAGFIYGYLNGWPINKTARLANTLAAVATTQYGGRSKFPTRKEMEKIVTFAESMKD